MTHGRQEFVSVRRRRRREEEREQKSYLFIKELTYWCGDAGVGEGVRYDAVSEMRTPVRDRGRGGGGGRASPSHPHRLPPDKPTGWGAPFLLVAACWLCYWNCLGCGFVFDDVSAVRDNRDVRGQTPVASVLANDFWGTPMSKEQSHKSYRPVTVLTFRLLNHSIHGLDPMGYHLVNLLLHCLVCVLYYRFCRLVLSVSPSSSLCASLLFAVHPVHTEAVTGVVGRAELLSSVFFLLALLSYRKAALGRGLSSLKSLAACLACVALAMLSKEQGITVLGVCAVYEVFMVQGLTVGRLMGQLPSPFDRKKSAVAVVNNNGSGAASPRKSPVRAGSRSAATAQLLDWRLVFRLGSLVLTGAALLLLRFYVMGSTLPVFTNFDNPASYEEYPTKQLTWSYLVAVNAWLLLAPADLCCDWTMGTIPLLRSASDPRNAATVATFVGLFGLGLFGLLGDSATSRRKDRTIVIMSLALAALPFLPASNLFFPVGFVVAERVLYLPSMGSCLLVAHGFGLLYRRSRSGSRSILKACFFGLLLAHGLRTVARNWDWEDERSIFLSGLKVNSGNAKLFNNVGHALEGQERYAEALEYFAQAVSVQPDDIGAHINVGRTHNNLGQHEEAERAYLLAKSLLPQARPGQKYTARVAPQHLSVFLNLANLVSRDPARLEEADALYRQAISMRSDYVQAHINRGDVLLRMNRSEEAQSVYERALTFDPDNPDLYYNLGVVHIERGKPRQALAYFERALGLDPDHVQALMNSAILIQESGSAELRPAAYSRLLRVEAMLLPEGNDRVYFNLGMLGMDDGDYESAEAWFRKAVALKPDFRSALFNLALLLNERARPLEAIPYLKSLLSSHPEHVKGLVLLGDIYTNHVRDFDEAESCYRRIVAADPEHVQAAHNLCVVMVEKGDLDGARECLVQVGDRAPDLEYVAKHLAIVENRIRQRQEQEQQQQQVSPQEEQVPAAGV